MGLVVDLQGSRIDVLDNPSAPAMYAVANEVACKLANFQTRFAFRFEASRKGDPERTRVESWRVGVIQNVLFEKNRFQWDDGTEHHVTWEKPVIDSSSLYGFPFYQDDPDSSQLRDPLVQNPYRDIYYGAQGFGELMDPWAKAPNNVVLKPDWWVTSADRPQFGCSLRTRRGGLLVHAEQVITFGIWLVAIATEGQHAPQVLAHAPPFTMVYSTTPRPAHRCGARPARARSQGANCQHEGATVGAGDNSCSLKAASLARSWRRPWSLAGTPHCRLACPSR